MPIVYRAKAMLVNESETNIERMAVKITQVANTDQGFIKTFPFTDYRNRTVMHLIKQEMPPYKRAAYIGISFKFYNFINYIEFLSTFREFALNKGDEVEFHFADDTVMKFMFQGSSSAFGPARKNVYPLADAQLEFIANNKLAYWKITNVVSGTMMLGGFGYQDDNKQYKSEKTGKQLFTVMAKEIMSAKALLNC